MKKPPVSPGTGLLTVVLVTYGDRWVYLSRVLERLSNDACVSRIVLVDNASSYSVGDSCRDASFDRVAVYRNDANLGSAGGFSQGIAIAARMEPGLILLLDDDVLPQEGAIESLVATYREVTEFNSGKPQAVAAYRFCQYGKLLVPEKPVPYQEHTSFGLNLFNFLHRHFLTNSTGHKTVTTVGCDLTRHGVAYAGLLLSKETVKTIGLPKPDFVLYSDDIEYSHRINTLGGNIWLDIGSEFVDICDNVSTSANTKPFIGFILNKSDVTTYYLIRNHIYLEKYCWCKNSIRYRLNFMVYFTVLIVTSLLMGKFRRTLVLGAALRDGMKGNLGFNPKFKLE